MKRTVIAVSLLLSIWLLTGCGKDEVLPNGTKMFGERILKDGTKTIKRIEMVNGEKQFEVIHLPNGVHKAERVELGNGTKMFGVTMLADGTTKAQRVELANGEKDFDTDSLDGTVKIARVEFPDGKKQFEVTQLSDGTRIVRRALKADGTEMAIFTNVQNDQQGYADAKWGSGVADVDPNVAGESERCFLASRDDIEENEAIAAAFGVPTRDTVAAGAVLSTSLDFSVVPAKCKSVTKGDVKLIFYDGKLAMAFTHLDAHNYDAIASEMASKFAEMDGWSVNWGGGATDDGDSTSVNVRLFKRGDTNTRVFLLKSVSHTGIGMNISSVYLLYVPNAYYQNAQEDMAKLKREQQAQQVAEQQKKEQPDLQKIQ